MKTFDEAVKASFTAKEPGYLSFTFGDRNEYELALEPLLFNNQYYLALYKDEELLLKEKVVVKPGYISTEEKDAKK